MRLAGMLVIMGMLVPVTRIDPDKVQHKRSHAALGAHLISELAKRDGRSLQQTAFQIAVMVEWQRSRPRDQILTHTLSNPKIELNGPSLQTSM